MIAGKQRRGATRRKLDSSKPDSNEPASQAGGEGDRALSKTVRPAADEQAYARSICLRLLASRARTRSELAGALAKKGIPDDVASAALDKFEELGFINDEAFASAWVQSRQSGRGLSGRALAFELRRKGVPDEIARAAITVVDADAELTKARDLVRRKLASMSGVAAEARYRRLAGMLARKGYSGSVTSRVVREALAGEGSEIDAE